MANRWGNSGWLFFWAPKSLQMVIAAMKLKDAYSLDGNVMTKLWPRQHIKKQRHYFANKGPSSQGYGFSSGHVSMWELDYKESWALKYWCFRTVVLEKTLESPLDCKEIQPVHSEGDQSWVFFGRNDAIAETPVVRPPHVKSWLIGKDSVAGRGWGQKEKGMTEDEMAGWHHWLDGHEFEWPQGDGDEQQGLACCDSWVCKESNMTERLNWEWLGSSVEHLFMYLSAIWDNIYSFLFFIFWLIIFCSSVLWVYIIWIWTPYQYISPSP